MRFPKKKISARATALALGLGLVGMLVTALPAFATTPTITAVAPTSGVRGTPVTITGTDFNTPATTGVTIDGVTSPFVIVSNTTITTSVPCAAATGAVQVRVTNGDGTSPNNGTLDDFTVLAATAPTITSFSPTAGTAGTTVVTITGTNLCGATSVKFNTTNQPTVTVNSATQVTATVPTGATTGKISVTTPVSTGISAADFTVGSPVITSFTPTIGLAGSTVVITGTNFTNATSVKFNGLAATYVVNSATQITTTVPTGATTGPISVTNAVGTATGATFTVGTPTHARSVSFGFDAHSRVSGQVIVSDGFNACRSLVPVVIQKQHGGAWKWVDTTATTKSGSFKTYIPPSSGTFRAKINKMTLVNGVVCGGDTSNAQHS